MDNLGCTNTYGRGVQDFKPIRLQDFASNFRTPKSMNLYQAYGEILKFPYA